MPDLTHPQNSRQDLRLRLKSPFDYFSFLSLCLDKPGSPSCWELPYLTILLPSARFLVIPTAASLLFLHLHFKPDPISHTHDGNHQPIFRRGSPKGWATCQQGTYVHWSHGAQVIHSSIQLKAAITTSIYWVLTMWRHCPKCCPCLDTTDL